ncbi:MAG: metallophosphoesterase [Rectinemataceae bacterium]|nr:metallophosphoesterase [Spirochaetaceae bacterium]
MTRNVRSSASLLARTTIMAAAGVALLLSAIMNIYHYTLEGARGFYIWHPIPLLRILLFMGLVPPFFAILSLPLEKLASKTAMKIVRAISLATSVLVMLASLGVLGALIYIPRSAALEPTALRLIDPARGLPPTETLNAPAFAAGSSTEPAAPQQDMSAVGNLFTPTSRPLLRLAVSSDAHWGADTANMQARTSILESIGTARPDAFFMLGDMVEMGNNVVQWELALADMEAYIRTIPFRPLLGNHDALLGGQYLWKKAFFPKGFSSDSGSPWYWSIRTPAATIVAVDLPWGTEQFGTRQRAWLEKTLAAADPALPIIVLSHSYFYASGYRDPVYGTPWYDHYQNIPALVPLFEKYGVDLVISGHNHYQELLSHNGVTYAIAGSMGGIPDPEPTYRSPWSRWIAVNSFGWLDVQVYEGYMDLIFRTETGEVRSSYRIAY